jgi:hypothetical protein
MNESIFLRELRVQLQRDNLTRALRRKLTGDPLAQALARTEKQNDLDVLSRWLDLTPTLAPEAILSELDK